MWIKKKKNQAQSKDTEESVEDYLKPWDEISALLTVTLHKATHSLYIIDLLNLKNFHFTEETEAENS